MKKFADWLIQREAEEPKPEDFATPPEERDRRDQLMNEPMPEEQPARRQVQADRQKESDKDWADRAKRHRRYRDAEAKAGMTPRQIRWGHLEF